MSGIKIPQLQLQTPNLTQTYKRRAAAASRIVNSSSTPVETTTTLYQVLQVKATASLSEIKAAYRNLAKLYHPDVSDSKNKSKTNNNFIAIRNAYSTLSDPVSRARYDLSIQAHNNHSFRTRRWETDQCW